MQYWSFIDVARDADRDRLHALPIGFDISVIPPRPMGWELPKTHGHIHVRADGSAGGYPELYQVLAGDAGFLFQDLAPGPSSLGIAMMEAQSGDVVVIPPLLHHVTVNLGSTFLVVADAVCRVSVDDYSALRAAHGMAYLVGVDGRFVPNPFYRTVPGLQRIPAQRWPGAPDDLYRALVGDPESLGWLCSEAGPPITLPARPASRW